LRRRHDRAGPAAQGGPSGKFFPMESQRVLVACAVFVVALAGLKLSLNLTGVPKTDGASLTPASRLVSEATDEGETSHQSQFITEDSPLWDCATMGNHQCGPLRSATFGTDADPRPLRMAGVEIHKRGCPKDKGAKVKLRLLNNSALYGHCKHDATSQDEGPEQPREPLTSPGRK
jgi:hypothetical protein